MALALDAAQAGLGWSSPNPMVGCVLILDGEVIGVGAHLRNGSEHAEVLALADAGDAAGATAYVNLEPCSHVGRQPSCCQALLDAGVTRVVYGVDDADPRALGAAKAKLENAGIAVTSGVLAEKCHRFLDYYLHSSREQKVFVHLKLALSLDAKMACKTGDSQWLSGAVSQGYAHYLRQKYDAVLVGSGTIKADNPRLTARPETMAEYFKLPGPTPARNPVRVILDTTFGLKRDLCWNFLSIAGKNYRSHLPRVIVAGDNKHLPPINGEGGPPKVTCLGLGGNGEGRLDLGELLDKLWETGIRSLLVEGGSQVAQGLISQSKVNKVSLVFTPRLLGSDALGFSPPMGFQSVGEGVSMYNMEMEKLGSDVLVSGYLGLENYPIV